MGIKDLRVLFTFAALVAGCASWLPAPTPLRTVASRVQEGRASKCLLVLLPGLGDTETDFIDHGFVDALRARNLPVDAIAVNATLGYYARRTLLERMRTDVIDPARASGYEQIWLAGISMGGLGSLLVSKDEEEHGRHIDGVLLIAPYLGNDPIQREIAAGGGIARWQSGGRNGKDDDDRDLWRWLKGATDKPDAAPTLYLAAGDDDRLSFGHKLVAAVLPKARVFGTKGKHDWGPWSVLWGDFLDHSDFRARCH
jgi:hypothetical protein